MTYFLIRHKASGEFMPQAKKDRGYSHWNPSTENKFYAALLVPRLIDTRKRAAKIISMWIVFQNAEIRGKYLDDDSISKPDGRTKDDLEIVEVSIMVRK